MLMLAYMYVQVANKGRAINSNISSALQLHDDCVILIIHMISLFIISVNIFKWQECLAIARNGRTMRKRSSDHKTSFLYLSLQFNPSNEKYFFN